MCGVDDCRIVPLVVCRAYLHRQHMRKSRPVTIFATDRQLRELRDSEMSISLRVAFGRPL